MGASADADTGVQFHMWDVHKGQLIRKFHSSLSRVQDLKIPGDGSKIFVLSDRHIAVVSILMGEEVDRGELWGGNSKGLFVRGSKVRVNGSLLEMGLWGSEGACLRNVPGWTRSRPRDAVS